LSFGFDFKFELWHFDLFYRLNREFHRPNHRITHDYEIEFARIVAFNIIHGGIGHPARSISASDQNQRYLFKKCNFAATSRTDKDISLPA